MESQEVVGMLESDTGALPDNAFKRWCDDLVDASVEAGKPMDFAKDLKDCYERAGFVDIQEKVFKIPINGWPRVPKLKRLGQLWHSNFSNGLSAFSYALLHRVKGMTQEEIEVSKATPSLASYKRPEVLLPIQTNFRQLTLDQIAISC